MGRLGEAGLLLAVGLAVTGCIFAVLWLVGRRRAQQPPVTGPERNGHFPVGVYVDRRSVPRRGGNPAPVLVTSDSLGSQHGVVLNRSTKGLCIAVKIAPNVGEVLSVLPAEVVDAPTVQVRVCNCRPVQGGYHLGCEFLQTPPWGVLLHFG